MKSGNNIQKADSVANNKTCLELFSQISLFVGFNIKNVN